jgi:hypothetical protein
MSLGAVLDVAIGLALIYLLLGLVASALQETYAALLKRRGAKLRDSIIALLAGKGTDDRVALGVAKSVFGHALVKGIGSNGLPSYVPARNFATAVLDVLSSGSKAPLFTQLESSVAALPADMPARESFGALLRQAGGDVDTFRTGVETWYNDAMDRLSGDYKRWSHYFALGFGLIVAVAFNVSTLDVAHELWVNPQERTALAAVAEKYAKQPAPSDDPAKLQQQALEAVKTLDSLSLPIGWGRLNGRAQDHAAQDNSGHPQGGLGVWAFIYWTIPGWLITALAVSLGAPFWFDTLQKLVSLRGTGPKPEQKPAFSGQENANG